MIFFFFVNQIIADSIEIEPPLEHKTIPKLIKAIVAFLRNFALALAPVIIVLAGYFFVTSGGDPAKIVQAKKMVIYALVGLAIILTAEGIVALIEEVIKK